VALIAQEAAQRGWVPVILTRGYLSQREKWGGVLPPSAEQPTLTVDPDEWGDEPALLRGRVPSAWICVGSNRLQVFKQEFLPRVCKEWGVEPEEALRRILVILDDGYQHRLIHRDIDLVAVTSASRSERLFREFDSSLRRAHLLIWTKGAQQPGPFQGDRCVRVEMKVAAPSAFQQGKKWWFVSGLGDPDSALKTIQAAGWNIVKSIIFRDHARYQPALLQSIRSDAEHSQCSILLTGKDWVKWQALGCEARPDLQVLEPELVFLSGRDQWDKLLWG
jgi:tetraacyldisaccharide 4'-kinase